MARLVPCQITAKTVTTCTANPEPVVVAALRRDQPAVFVVEVAEPFELHAGQRTETPVAGQTLISHAAMKTSALHRIHPVGLVCATTRSGAIVRSPPLTGARLGWTRALPPNQAHNPPAWRQRRRPAPVERFSLLATSVADSGILLETRRARNRMLRAGVPAVGVSAEVQTLRLRAWVPMSRAKETKTARQRDRRFWRGSDGRVPRGEDALVTTIQAEIWHRRYPPSSVMQALSTRCGHPVPASEMRVFAGLDSMLRVCGWTFIKECSGPQILTWSYGPSDAGAAHLDRGREPITTIVAILDRSIPTDTVQDRAVEVLLVGVPRGLSRLTTLAGLTTHLGAIEAYRPGDRIPIPYPTGRARPPSM
ncbi:hypothetical protein ACW9HC_34775 [Nocardia gipuzkoensis]